MTTKPRPKHLTLRPAEVARFLRPSGLVVIPEPRLQKIPDNRTFIFRGDRVWASLVTDEELAPYMGKPPETVYGGQVIFVDGVWYTPIVVGGGAGRAMECPLGGPGDQWVGREEFIPCQSIGFPCKPSEASYVCFRDGEQHYRNGKHSKWTLKDPPNWKAERHVFLPARRMPDWAARICKTTTHVELRRVRMITEAEAQDAGFDGQQHNLGHGNIGETTPSEVFADDFNSRYPDAWDRDDYAFFCWYTDTLGKD